MPRFCGIKIRLPKFLKRRSRKVLPWPKSEKVDDRNVEYESIQQVLEARQQLQRRLDNLFCVCPSVSTESLNSSAKCPETPLTGDAKLVETQAIKATDYFGQLIPKKDIKQKHKTTTKKIIVNNSVSTNVDTKDKKDVTPKQNVTEHTSQQEINQVVKKLLDEIIKNATTGTSYNNGSSKVTTYGETPLIDTQAIKAKDCFGQLTPKKDIKQKHKTSTKKIIVNNSVSTNVDTKDKKDVTPKQNVTENTSQQEINQVVKKLLDEIIKNATTGTSYNNGSSKVTTYGETIVNNSTSHNVTKVKKDVTPKQNATESDKQINQVVKKLLDEIIKNATSTSYNNRSSKVTTYGETPLTDDAKLVDTQAIKAKDYFSQVTPKKNIKQKHKTTTKKTTVNNSTSHNVTKDKKDVTPKQNATESHQQINQVVKRLLDEIIKNATTGTSYNNGSSKVTTYGETPLTDDAKLVDTQVIKAKDYVSQDTPKKDIKQKHKTTTKKSIINNSTSHVTKDKKDVTPKQNVTVNASHEINQVVKKLLDEIIRNATIGTSYNNGSSKVTTYVNNSTSHNVTKDKKDVTPKQNVTENTSHQQINQVAKKFLDEIIRNAITGTSYNSGSSKVTTFGDLEIVKQSGKAAVKIPTGKLETVCVKETGTTQDGKKNSTVKLNYEEEKVVEKKAEILSIHSNNKKSAIGDSIQFHSTLAKLTKETEGLIDDEYTGDGGIIASDSLTKEQQDVEMCKAFELYDDEDAIFWADLGPMGPGVQNESEARAETAAERLAAKLATKMSNKNCTDLEKDPDKAVPPDIDEKKNIA